MTKRYRSSTHLLLIGDETMEAMFAVKGVYNADEGADPWVGVARILEDRLDIDLTDPENADVAIKIDNEDFSYLAPQPQHGIYTTISSLLEIYDNKRAGWDELHPEVQYRYGMLIGSIGNLMYSLVDAEEERKALAA
ncbi:hypothetical protein ASG43_17495 [Aureimonas sp. Leaf454]|uniref:hypothetical protein n=1 Tax=Aureimonas sp. Leaf454 TaxID=1736381 RepID=UPI0006F5EED8|nr:hypothetical protein [Aureimonas sp. Leaf454]KQT42070.1 hypothetical protein ASG43_17495 [Aureimonas sp. Leaf454]